mgnify:FL=1
MKRSFYEMLGIARDADQPRIDIAYRQAKAAHSRGGSGDAAVQAKLLDEGYAILSNPEQRARYDAKLAEAEQEVEITLFPTDRYGRTRLGIGTVVLVILSSILGTIIYRNLSVKMDEVRVEHVQSVIKHKEEQPKAIVIDKIYASPVTPGSPVSRGEPASR